jgi:hypothetical protein
MHKLGKSSFDPIYSYNLPPTADVRRPSYKQHGKVSIGDLKICSYEPTSLNDILTVLEEEKGKKKKKLAFFNGDHSPIVDNKDISSYNIETLYDDFGIYYDDVKRGVVILSSTFEKEKKNREKLKKGRQKAKDVEMGNGGVGALEVNISEVSIKTEEILEDFKPEISSFLKSHDTKEVTKKDFSTTHSSRDSFTFISTSQESVEKSSQLKQEHRRTYEIFSSPLNIELKENEKKSDYMPFSHPVVLHPAFSSDFVKISKSGLSASLYNHNMGFSNAVATHGFFFFIYVFILVNFGYIYL